MILKAVRVDFANALSSRVIYVSDEEYGRLVSAYTGGQARYSVRHRLTQDDPQERTWHLDLNGVVSIVEL